MKNPHHLINRSCVCQTHSCFREGNETQEVSLEGAGPKASKKLWDCIQPSAEENWSIQDVEQIKMR